MQDINHVVLVGRLTKAVNEENKTFSYVGSTAKASFSIAVNRSVKKGEERVEETSFFDVVLWGKVAEGLKSYLQRGTQICVDGYLKQERWEKDGKTNSRIVINANSIQLVGGKGSSGGSNNNNDSAPTDDMGFPEDCPF